MVLLNLITKGLNKAIASKFLRLSLRIHQTIPINAISLLPLSQRLVSIEVQDDYRQLGETNDNNGVLSNVSKSFDEFVERTWNILGLERMVDRENDPSESRDQIESQKRTGIIIQEDELIQRCHERVELLKQYISPALSSNTVNPPQTFVKWIRGEYLIAKYGLQVQEAVRKYPELKDDAAGLSTFDVQTIDGKEAEFPLDVILPTVKTVRRAFGMEDWSRVKMPINSLKINAKHSDTMSIEDIIHHRLQGQIVHSGPLNAYFEMRRREDSYELWTKDYIFGLANYLLQRIEDMNKESDHDDIETTVLDVGAGDGRLVYFLRRAMKEIESSKNIIQVGRKGHNPRFKSTIPTLIATDDGSWRAPIYKTSHIQVEQLTAEQAVDKYAPNLGESNRRLIVLCSWMPPGEDWTYLFRQSLNIDTSNDKQLGKSSEENRTGRVEEYILIGESDDGTCGHLWETWGNFSVLPDDESNTILLEPPYAQNGYIRVDIEELSELQFSRFDCKRSSESRTVSFRRGS